MSRISKHCWPSTKRRQPRVFPEFLPREEQKHYVNPKDILGRSGFRIDRSTQWRWMRGLARGVTPLVDLMWDLARQSAVLGMDETPVMELGGPGRTLKGYLWAGVGDAAHPYDCFFYTSDRRSIRAETILTGFQGYLTADAYVVHVDQDM